MTKVNLCCLYAALKRRSSTMVSAFGMLKAYPDTSLQNQSDINFKNGVAGFRGSHLSQKARKDGAPFLMNAIEINVKATDRACPELAEGSVRSHGRRRGGESRQQVPHGLWHRSE